MQGFLMSFPHGLLMSKLFFQLCDDTFCPHSLAFIIFTLLRIFNIICNEFIAARKKYDHFVAAGNQMALQLRCKVHERKI